MSGEEHNRCLVVISYYDRRPLGNLVGLLDSMAAFPAGDVCDVCIVVNRTKNEDLTLPARFRHIPVRYRQNTGMNIGAWDFGWREAQRYRDYVFLQDECYVIRGGWLCAYRGACADGVGMVGESINQAWDAAWGTLRERMANVRLPEHTLRGVPVNRVDFYAEMFKTYGTPPGDTGRHLRSLVWYLTLDTLRRIDGFNIGRNYGECIAAEIAASKKVEAIGRRVVQVCEEEFSYIRHLEYNQDHPGAAYTHNVRYVPAASLQRHIEGLSILGFTTGKLRGWVRAVRAKLAAGSTKT